MHFVVCSIIALQPLRSNITHVLRGGLMARAPLPRTHVQSNTDTLPTATLPYTTDYTVRLAPQGAVLIGKDAKAKDHSEELKHGLHCELLLDLGVFVGAKGSRWQGYTSVYRRETRFCGMMSLWRTSHRFRRHPWNTIVWRGDVVGRGHFHSRGIPQNLLSSR